MYKYLIIGAGAQGASCASILAKDDDTAEIILSDIDVSQAKRVLERINSPKIKVEKADASSISELEKLAAGVDVILNFTLVKFNDNIMAAALAAGAHYVDTAFDNPIWTLLEKEHPLKIGEKFSEKKLTGIVGCGGAPGLVNVFARYIADTMEEIESIKIRVGHRELVEQGKISTWIPAWCPEIALTDYADPPTVFTNGEYTTVPAFDGLEEYEFPAPVGKNLIAHHHHEEPVTLPRFIGKGLKHVEFKYAVDLNAASFVKMGFASYDKINVKGVEVAPIDVLMKLVRQPSDTFFTETEETAGADPTVAHPYLIEVEGKKDGKPLQHKVWYPSSLTSDGSERLDVFRRFGTTTIAVALPAVAGAKMILKGKAEPGVISPECLDPVRFLKEMAQLGWAVKFDEDIKSTSLIEN
ncbi:MAG: saccharopine dehydrogenase NADP-binding domain-containing protein [Desulfobacterales bacterium]|nr:saccharopine dehydrogenase NADP-binding domain-containing protein [Desulfobacterales bacterium]